MAAPVFTMTSLALDDEEHSRTDYVATGTRAFVAGGLSSAIAAGVVGPDHRVFLPNDII